MVLPGTSIQATALPQYLCSNAARSSSLGGQCYNRRCRLASTTGKRQIDCMSSTEVPKVYRHYRRLPWSLVSSPDGRSCHKKCVVAQAPRTSLRTSTAQSTFSVPQQLFCPCSRFSPWIILATWSSSQLQLALIHVQGFHSKQR